jgi:hypothetical protein
MQLALLALLGTTGFSGHARPMWSSYGLEEMRPTAHYDNRI